MADRIINLLTTCFWDLQSQCESQVRTLSAAQRLLDEYRRLCGPTDREALLRNLREKLNDLTAANSAIHEVAADVRRRIDHVPARSHRKDKR